jgi:1-acyl-sn-glycerol-3-phosphate acyltransferase
MSLKRILSILYKPYEWLVFCPFFFLNTIIFGLLAVIFSFTINARVGSYIGGVIWSKINALAVPMIPRVLGRKNIVKNQSYIVISNHQSHFDVFLIYGWIGLDIKFVMKADLKKIPGLGIGAEKVGHIFLDRSNSRAAVESLAVAKRRLVNGTSVVFFPEGTRSRTGEMGNFKRGGFKLAIDLGLPILPVTTINTRKVLPANTLNLNPAFVKLIIHEPVSIEGYTEENMPELMQKIKDIIAGPLNMQKV